MDRSVSIILPYYNRKELIIHTLRSFELLYVNKNVEIVIVDDGSNKQNMLEDIVSNFNLNIKLIRIGNKNGINPCYPYNVGVRHSTGDIIVLSSPETLHTKSIYEVSNNFELLNEDSYLFFSVFCITDEKMLKEIIEQDYSVELFREHFHKNLGELGYEYNNKYGSWYTHSKYKKTDLNFLSVMTSKNYKELSGFDERFRFGTGLDDNEFSERCRQLIDKFIYYDDMEAIHINHEQVSVGNQVSNMGLYNTKSNYEKNDKWGLL